jgi:glycine/D-amino acid oxidase-like deaminating enzyme
MIRRRAVLSGGGALAAAFLLGDRRAAARALPVPATFARSRVVRRLVGLRPYRPAGFDLAVETVAGKTVLHHVGHGGAGLTLSWGTARLVVDRLLELGLRGPVAVLGAGAVGLATARLLQEEGLPVTLHASHRHPRITSSVAGASWYPSLVVDREQRTPAFEGQLERALRFSHARYESLIGRGFGVFRRPHLVLADGPPEAGWRENLVPDLLPLPEPVGEADLPLRAPWVGRTRRLFIETPTYLPALEALVRQAGARFHQRVFTAASDLASLPEPVLVNCTGMGSAGLFGRADLVPVQGQLSLLPPDRRFGFTVSADGLYLHPRRDGLLLGGTQVFGAERPVFDPRAEEQILAGFRSLLAAVP